MVTTTPQKLVGHSSIIRRLEKAWSRLKRFSRLGIFVDFRHTLIENLHSSVSRRDLAVPRIFHRFLLAKLELQLQSTHVAGNRGRKLAIGRYFSHPRLSSPVCFIYKELDCDSGVTGSLGQSGRLHSPCSLELLGTHWTAILSTLLLMEQSLQHRNTTTFLNTGTRTTLK